MNALLGVLGGMGPLATVDFLGKLIEETPAKRDAEHIPVAVYSVPQIPDRPRAIPSRTGNRRCRLRNIIPSGPGRRRRGADRHQRHARRRHLSAAPGGAGYRCIANSAADLDALVLPAIAHVKTNALESAHTLAVRAALNLQTAGAQAVILACTEIPLALEHRSSDIAAICVDPTRALAQECVRWWRSTPD